MNRSKSLYPRLGLVAAGVALGLLARQILGSPEEDTRPKLSIDRPIAEDVELDEVGDVYVPLDLPVEPVEQTGS